MPEKKMLLASRANPPRYLKVSPRPVNRGSSLKEFLLHSPLPSPALPSILPRHGKKPPVLNSRKIVRGLCWLSILTGAFYMITFFRQIQISVRHTPIYESQTYRHSDGQSYEIVEDSNLPDFSSPLAVTDSKGNSRWTVHIPANRGFPLSSQEYVSICAHVDEVIQHVASISGNENQIANLGYYDQDPNYIDVAEAQLNDLIPFDPSFKPGGTTPLCKSTMIYVLDSSDASLGGTLLRLWLAYGLAQRENRAFFIDDTHFAYGKYADLFDRPPVPNCRPPPRTHRVPCPRMSQHLVVSSATWKWTFGEAFHNKFSDEQIFAMMRVGYEFLFKLLPDDQLYVAQRVTELRQQASPGKILAGMHVRRGDRHPDEFQYSQGYIPPTEYLSALKELVDETSPITAGSLLGLGKSGQESHTFILASDDSAMYKDSELSFSAIRAQDRIVLDSAVLNSQSNSKSLSADLLGISRGFFSSAFYSLGIPDTLSYLHQQPSSQSHMQNSPLPTKDTRYQQRILGQNGKGLERRDYRVNPSKEALRLRNLVGRSYLLDLAVLAGASERLVCAVSSGGCRVLGVMMGWEQVEKGHWKNIDHASTRSTGTTDGWRADLS